MVTGLWEKFIRSSVRLITGLWEKCLDLVRDKITVEIGNWTQGEAYDLGRDKITIEIGNWTLLEVYRLRER